MADRVQVSIFRSTVLIVMEFSGRHFEKTIILQAVRWCLAYALRYRDVEDLMGERSVSVCYSTIHPRWVVKFSPLLADEFRKRRWKPGGRWRMDETYIKVRGQWKYLYRAVAAKGNAIDFLLTARCGHKAAGDFLKRAAQGGGQPKLVSIDKSGVNAMAIEKFCNGHNTLITVRQNKHMNNIVDQDRRRIKRRTRPMMRFNSFRSAQNTLAGIETVAQMRKGQIRFAGHLPMPRQFDMLAA